MFFFFFFFFHKMTNSHRRRNLSRKSKLMKFGLKRKQPLEGRWRVLFRVSFQTLVVGARVFRTRALRKLGGMRLPN